MHGREIVASGGALMLILLPLTARSQTTPTDPGTAAQLPGDGAQPAGEPGRATGRRTYDAAYFAQFSPATALQIAQRVPGFAIEQVDPSVRGFGGSAGNVVINGQRPSSKTDTIETILARIPASRVLRAEVGPGDLYASEYSGKSQVLNLVLTATGGVSTTIEATVRRDFTGKLFPEGSASTLVRRGNSTFNASLTFGNAQSSEEGTDTLTALPSGELVEFRRKVNTIADPNGAIAASWDYNGGPNKTAHLNVRTAVDRFALTQNNDVFPVGGTIRDDFLTQRYHNNQYELGGDVARPFAGGGLKLIGLATRRYRDNRDVSLNRVQSDVIGGFTQKLDDTLEETLGRVVWNRSAWGGWNVEAGFEGVINRLDSNVDLFALDDMGGSTRIDLPIDHAVVKEMRGEAFVNAGRPLSAKLRVDLALNFEASNLKVTGEAKAQRTLKFLKPKVVLDWRPAGKWHAQLTIQRTVAQLQFEDFIGSAELANDRVNGGNAELLPQRAWETLATIERPILGEGVFRLEAGYNRISLVQDRVPTPEGFDAPGNLGNGSTYILRNRIEAPLKTLGIKGGRVILYGSYVATSVRDPYTLTERPFSGNSAFYGEATFRQDLTHFAWGVTLNGSTTPTAYRLDELDSFPQGFPYLTAFVEWRPKPNTTLTASLDNAAGVQGLRDRLFFAPDRRTPDPFLREFRERNKHVVPAITFKRTFG